MMHVIKAAVAGVVEDRMVGYKCWLSGRSVPSLVFVLLTWYRWYNSFWSDRGPTAELPMAFIIQPWITIMKTKVIFLCEAQLLLKYDGNEEYLKKYDGETHHHSPCAVSIRGLLRYLYLLLWGLQMKTNGFEYNWHVTLWPGCLGHWGLGTGSNNTILITTD